MHTPTFISISLLLLRVVTASPNIEIKDGLTITANAESIDKQYCGPTHGGKSCLAISLKPCCNAKGECSSSLHDCDVKQGCQEEYGNCKNSPAPRDVLVEEPTSQKEENERVVIVSTVEKQVAGKDVRNTSVGKHCGPHHGDSICDCTSYQRCCSAKGRCVGSPLKCRLSHGCQPGFGYCRGL